MVFELDRVCFSYGQRKAIDNVSLGIAPGRFHAVMGPNGCGKTTLLDLLSGHLKPGSGRIRFNGKDIGSYGKKALARSIALTPQDYRVNFPYTVREVVGMGRYPHRPRFGRPSAEDTRIVETAIEVCGASSLADRLITELSGGEKQRVVFARAVAQQTPVLLLDEPCSGLDVKHALEILAVSAARVRCSGVTAIAVMHDINLAARFADNFIFMKNGRVLGSGVARRDLDSEMIRHVFDIESIVKMEQNLKVPQVVFLQ